MDPHTGVLPSLKVMVDRSARWKFSWQQSPLAACPQEVKDGVEDGTKFGGARSPTRSRRRQNRRNKSPRRIRQIGVVESSAHRTVPLTRISALSRQTSTFQTPSKIRRVWDGFLPRSRRDCRIQPGVLTPANVHPRRRALKPKGAQDLTRQ